jgi:phosphatidylserine/phosphatidylglycerophosphate/cardiolipin synthase-like enzyme
MSEPIKSGGELFIVDNSDESWKGLKYLQDWTEIASSFDIATGFFEIGSLLALDGRWQKLDTIRILMGDQATARTRQALLEGVRKHVCQKLDASLEAEKETNDMLAGTGAIVEALRQGKIQCRVYAKRKFHAKAYITHPRLAVVGSVALVGSSNFTLPGLTENIELNIQIRAPGDVSQLQAWYEHHWQQAEDMHTPTPTNAELARLFLDVMARTSASHLTLREATKRIREHAGSIAEVFQKEGSLQGLKIRWLSREFHSVLEDILRDGVEKTGDRAVKEDVAGQRRRAFLGIPGSASAHTRPESTSPGWENAIRAQED